MGLVLGLLACGGAQPAAPVSSVEPAPGVAPAPVAAAEPGSYCRQLPPAGQACWGRLGGLYGHGACGADAQCCAGAWSASGTCGACACAEPTGRDGCVPAGETLCSAPFDGAAQPLSEADRAAMTGVVWRPGCPVGLDELARISAPIWGMDGAPGRGELIVRADLAPAFLDVLEHAWRVRFPIERMEPVHAFGGDDDASMAANNSSAFNCRGVAGGASYSMHSYGHAVDINPRQNPYVRGERVLPPDGRPYLDRDPAVPGLIVDPGPITGAFRRHGFGWGGAWRSLKDYQHFSENGR